MFSCQRQLGTDRSRREPEKLSQFGGSVAFQIAEGEQDALLPRQAVEQLLPIDPVVFRRSTQRFRKGFRCGFEPRVTETI